MKVIRNNAADDDDNYCTAEDMTKTKMDHIDMLEDEGNSKLTRCCLVSPSGRRLDCSAILWKGRVTTRQSGYD